MSTRSSPREAAEEAVRSALDGLGKPEAALLFASGAWGEALPALLDTAVAALGTEAVVGASAHGVLAGGEEREVEPAVVVLAQAGLEAHPFLVPDLHGDEVAAGEEIAARLGGPGRPEDLVIVLPDPRAFRPDSLFDSLRESLGSARVVGAGASDPVAGAPLQWCGRKLESGALAGLVLRARRPPRIGVTQACRPATGLLTVTRARGHWILELDGRPALEVYREVARGPLADDLRRAATFLLVALPRDDSESLAPGSYLVRNVAGFAIKENAFAIPQPVAVGQRIALVEREPEAAREDLKVMLAGLAGESPAFGLYFNCCARGTSLFGVPGLEAAYLENAFGTVPIAGTFGSCEIGPIGQTTELLTYTGVLALIDD